ncbi:MAG: phosphatidate cytidylyltransferase [Bryobacteraceae bacterium]|nr:phosphatidate cytidylyltransferase [Bryobacteraceae bacterium]
MTRILTALVLIPAVLGIMFAAPPWLAFLALFAVACLCYAEYAALVEAMGLPSFALIGYVCGFILLAAPAGGGLTLTLLGLLGMALALRGADLTKALASSGAFILGIVYIFGAWRMALDLGQISPHWLLLACAINWVGDTAAMVTGRAIGKHKLAPVVSPGKTWEGAIASVLASMLFGVGYILWAIPSFPWSKTLLIAAVGNVAGQFGDLAESALKRGAGVKDSGTMLPGHGGWLDRVDSTLFAMPVVRLLLLPWL